MALQKTAVALPQDLLAELDRAAEERAESRNRFIIRVLRAALKAKRDAEITRKLDELFADEEIASEQLRVAREVDAAGHRWDDERW